MGRDCYGPSLLWAEMSRNRMDKFIFIIIIANKVKTEEVFSCSTAVFV